MPFYVALLSIKLLPSENITPKKLAGITVGFLGVVLIFREQLHLSHPMAVYGMVAVLISSAFSAYGTILGKNARQRFHAVTLNTFPLLYTSVSLFTMHFLFESGQPAHYTIPAILSFFYLGIVGTAVTFVLYFWLLKSTPAVLVSLTTFITPPLALIWDWAVLG